MNDTYLPHSEWLSLHEAAQLLGVHPSTVRNWSNQGALPVYRTSGGHRRYKRSEVELWASSARQVKEIAPASMMQAALGQIRMHIAEGHLEAQTWYQKLDAEARLQYRHGGMMLVNGLMVYLSSAEDEGMSEAHAIGYQYASRAHRYALSVLEAVQAYLFFRNALLESVMSVYENAKVPNPGAYAETLRRINHFADAVLVNLLQTYQTLSEAQK